MMEQMKGKRGFFSKIDTDSVLWKIGANRRQGGFPFHIIFTNLFLFFYAHIFKRFYLKAIVLYTGKGES